MISRTSLRRVYRFTKSGRTKPLVASCGSLDDEVDIVMKVSDGCDLGVTSLAREVIAALLASDLGLPVPQPWLVEIPSDYVHRFLDPETAAKLRISSPVAFGSTYEDTFGIWAHNSHVPEAGVPMAAAILLFDAIIQNHDRRTFNPNLLVNGDELRIIDHEMAFSHNLILLWKPPWEQGGLEHLSTPGAHVLVQELIGMEVDFSWARERWQRLTDARILGYKDAVPLEWADAGDNIDAAVSLIREARDRIDSCIEELRRILK